jgi:hypothetical protein
MSEIEKDFEEAVKQINLKIKESAELFKQARKLGQSIGLRKLNYVEYFQYDEDDVLSEEDQNRLYEAGVDITPLFDELDEAGWRTSSIVC